MGCKGVGCKGVGCGECKGKLLSMHHLAEPSVETLHVTSLQTVLTDICLNASHPSTALGGIFSNLSVDRWGCLVFWGMYRILLSTPHTPHPLLHIAFLCQKKPTPTFTFSMTASSHMIIELLQPIARIIVTMLLLGVRRKP